MCPTLDPRQLPKNALFTLVRNLTENITLERTGKKGITNITHLIKSVMPLVFAKGPVVYTFVIFYCVVYPQFMNPFF